MKKDIVILYLIIIPVFGFSQTNEVVKNDDKRKTNYHYLKQKIDLCLAVEGDILRTLGNIGVFFWNAGMRYEKDNEGNKIKNEYGDYVYLYPERKLDFLKNNFGGNLKLDYLLTPTLTISTGINATLYHESIFGIAVNNSGYFCEAQIKPHRGADTYFFGKFGSVTSNFSENISLNHYQYATGIGLGNDYVGLDVGFNFFSTPTEKKTTFLENYENPIPGKTYLESAQVMLRLTAKFL
tara:strand:- start:71 stop:784 length:714 start_codon:yes stop_codon:yes gene_type:complete